MYLLFVLFTVFIMNPEKGEENLYLELKKKGIEMLKNYERKYPLRIPQILYLEVLKNGNGKIPPWASGLYYDKKIILKYDNMENLLKVLNHELAHSILDETIRPNRVPLWFEEGFAQILAGESIDFFTLTLLYITGGNGLRNLSFNFPQSLFWKRMAYAKAHLFVFKMVEKMGWDGFYLFLFDLKKGIPFQTAFLNNMGENLNSFEKKFKKERMQKFLIFLGTGSVFFWFFLSLLIIYAYFLKRKKSKEMVKSWEEDDTNLPYF